MSFFYTANQLSYNASLRVQRSSASAGAINGTGIDIGELEGPLLILVDAPVASTADTINFTVETSESLSTGYAAISASALISPSTGAAATFTQVTASVAVFEALAINRELCKRYVRVVATTAGSGIDVTFAAYILGMKKYA